MFKIIAIAAVGAVLAVLAYAATRPSSFHVARSTLIQAPPEQVFALIEDFHAWRAWSPYEKLDPAMTRSYAGPAKGVGATYAWQSQGKAGVGSMEIVKAVAPSQVVIALTFTKPMATRNTATFTLAPEGQATRVTWAMDGPAPFLFKLMGLFLNMDRMIGTDFETGLASLKTEAER